MSDLPALILTLELFQLYFWSCILFLRDSNGLDFCICIVLVCLLLLFVFQAVFNRYYKSNYGKLNYIVFWGGLYCSLLIFFCVFV